MNAGSTKRTATPSRREEARALFHNAILEAAEQIFAERGFHAARIQDIAERARTAVGTVYNHFETKEDILRALLEERTGALVTAFEPQKDEGSTFEARLTARLTRLLSYIGEHRAFFTVAFEHGLVGSSSGAAAAALGNKRVRHIERFKTAFRNLIQEGIDDGTLEKEDPARLSRFLGGAMKAFMFIGLEDVKGRLEDEAPVIVNLFLHGAAKRTTRRPR